jgi:hypothetical protein
MSAEKVSTTLDDLEGCLEGILSAVDSVCGIIGVPPDLEKNSPPMATESSVAGRIMSLRQEAYTVSAKLAALNEFIRQHF